MNISDTVLSAKTFQHRCLMVYSGFAVVFFASFAPIFFADSFSSELLFGLPAFTAWLTICFVLYLVLIILAYRQVFRYWDGTVPEGLAGPAGLAGLAGPEGKE